MLLARFIAISISGFPYEKKQLMCRMAPLLGGDLSRRVFLERFAALCSDGLFHVRKICAANFGEFSSVVGQEITENVLVNTVSLIYSSSTLYYNSHVLEVRNPNILVHPDDCTR